MSRRKLGIVTYVPNVNIMARCHVRISAKITSFSCMFCFVWRMRFPDINIMA